MVANSTVGVRSKAEQDRSGTAIVCGCFSLKRSDILSHIARNPTQSFDAFLKETGAGGKCTACMLDLEHYFVEAPRDTVPEEISTETSKSHVRGPLKQRVYDLLDRMSPMVALPLTDYMPVFHGTGFETRLWIANHALLYGESGKETPFDVDLAVFTGEGRKVFTGRERLEPGGEIRFDVADHLPPDGPPSIGSLHVVRRGLRPGVRGTTRPQVEFLTPTAATALHCQSAHGAYDKRFSFRPSADDRTLFTVVNCGPKPMTMKFVYAAADWPGRVLAEDRVTLPAFGASLREAPLSSDEMGDSGLALVHFRSNGYGKIHVVNAARDLSRLSLDHL